MADHNISINVDLNGAERAKNDLRTLDSTINSINSKTISPRLETAQIQRYVVSLRRELESLTRQRNHISLELEMRGNIEAKIASLKKELAELTPNKGGLLTLTGGAAQTNVEAQRRALEAQIRQQEELLKAVPNSSGDLERVNGEMGVLNDKLKEARLRQAEIAADEGLKHAFELETTPLDQAISKLQTLSAVMSDIGTGFQGVNNFIGGIGNSFSMMSGLFGTNIMDYAKQALTFMGTRMLMGNIGDMVNRYDILTTFSDYMDIAGVDRATSDAALQRVNKSILGLPIGLDESAYRLRRYQMFMGDTEQATNFTIGLQNALTAGGASESMRNMAYQQMERLIATGDLSTFRQWQSLITGFGVSAKFISDAISSITGTQITPKQLTEGLNDGTIAVEQFMKAVEMLGQDWEGAASVPQFVTDMNKALDVYRGTLEAWQKNIRFAVTRGGANVITALNESMQKVEGMGITDVLEDVRDLINEIFAGGAEYIKNNPQNIVSVFDMIGGLMERAKGLNFGTFADSFMGNIGRLFDAAAVAFDAIPPGALEEFASFALTIAGPAGGLIKTMQSGFPQMLAVFEAFKTFDFEGFMGSVTDNLGLYTDVVGGLLKLFNNDVASNIGAFALVWGPSLVKVFQGLSSAFSYISASLSALSGIGNATLLTKLIQLVPSIASGLAAAGPVLAYAAPAAAALIGTGIVEKNYRRELAENASLGLLTNVGDVEEMLAESALIPENFEAQKAEWDKSIQEVDSRADYASELIQRIRNTNAKIISTSISPNEREELKAALEGDLNLWNEMFPDVAMNMKNGKLSEGSADFANGMVDQYIALMNAQEYMEATSNARVAAIQQVAEAEAEREKLQESLDEQRSYRRRLSIDLKAQQEKVLTMEGNDIQREQQLAVVEGIETALSMADEKISGTEEQLQAINDVIEDGTGLIEKYNLQWKDYYNTVLELQNKDFMVEGETKAFEELTERQQEMITAYETFRETARETIQEAMAGWDPIEDVPNAGPGIASLVTGQTDQNSKLNYANKALLDIDAALREMAKTDPKKLEEIGGAVGEIIDTAAGDFSQRGLLYSLRDSLQGDMSDIDELVEQLEIEATGEDGWATKLADIRNLLSFGSEYEEESGKNPSLFEGVPELLEQLNDLDMSNASEQLDDYSGKLESTGDNANNAASGIERVGTSTDKMAAIARAKVGAVQSMSGNMGSLSAAASMAAAAINAVKAAMDAIHDKTVNFRVNTSGGGSFLEGTSHYAELYGSAEGGWAGTGKILSGPSGTDIYPHMLSPGEFVIKRSAAQKFGPTFLKAVNGMDIDGAFDALMHNLARPSGMYMPTVSYNRDNHAQVNINNYGETGQGYSQRKAYAWASKL